MNKYDNIFDKIEILADDLNCPCNIETYYEATFHDKLLKDYEGFYYQNCNVAPFKNVSDGDISESARFDTIDEIINLIPGAKDYHQDTTHIFVDRYMSFVGQDGKNLLFIHAGTKKIELEKNLDTNSQQIIGVLNESPSLFVHSV